jgi:tRNA dimethylallyltransferase
MPMSVGVKDETVMPLLLILTGPTASGKTALALRAAQELGLEIVGADSRQVHAGLAVATAAPTAAERALVRHHLVGHVPLTASYSAGQFARECRAVLGLPPLAPAAAAPGDGPAVAPPARLPFLLCGGSGFYLRALLDPVSPALMADAGRRAQVRRLSATLPPAEFRALVLEHDPAAAWIPAGDQVRLERYLEISLAAGRPATLALADQAAPRPVRPLLVSLEAPLDWLEERIRLRSRRMLEEGMVEEVAAALAAGAPRDSGALRSVGVEEVLDLLAGRLDREGCLARLTLRTRQLAKRQLTWLRGLARREEVLRLDPRQEEGVLCRTVIEAWRRAGERP